MFPLGAETEFKPLLAAEGQGYVGRCVCMHVGRSGQVWTHVNTCGWVWTRACVWIHVQMQCGQGTICRPHPAFLPTLSKQPGSRGLPCPHLPTGTSHLLCTGDPAEATAGPSRKARASGRHTLLRETHTARCEPLSLPVSTVVGGQGLMEIQGLHTFSTEDITWMCGWKRNGSTTATETGRLGHNRRPAWLDQS